MLGENKLPRNVMFGKNECGTEIEQLTELCEEMGVDPNPQAHASDWREEMAALCEEMGIDQHAPCHDWREQLAALCAEVGVVMYDRVV